MAPSAASTDLCTLTLVVGEVQSPAGGVGDRCVFEGTPTGQRTTLRYPCQGGEAVAVFDEKTFRGTVDGDQLQLEATHDFTWQDGCRWHNTQRIEGALSSAELRYSYEEARPVGRRCQAMCPGTARVLVEK